MLSYPLIYGGLSEYLVPAIIGVSLLALGWVSIAIGRRKHLSGIKLSGQFFKEGISVEEKGF